MPKHVTVEDILPLVDRLPAGEKLRLLRLVSTRAGAHDLDAYRAAPVRDSEFSNNDESLAWDAEGWEDIG
jgi:hypothetical protein